MAIEGFQISLYPYGRPYGVQKKDPTHVFDEKHYHRLVSRNPPVSPRIAIRLALKRK